MDPSDERRIERFIRDPESMSDDRRRAVERLIEEDQGARVYAEFLQGFYNRLDDEPLTPSGKRVSEFVASLFREEHEAVVPLRPFRSNPNPRPTVLAADTQTTRADASSDGRRFSVLTTLATETEDLLVRVMEDRETGQGRLYVLTDSPEQQAHVVVSFPDLGLDLVTDEDGRRTFDLPREGSPEQWDETRAVVRRPVASKTVRMESEFAVTVPGGGTLLGEWDEKSLRVELEPYESDGPSLLAVTSPEDSARLFRLDASSPVEYIPSSEASRVLRVYE